MTLRRALTVTRARRLRPGVYRGASGGLVALLFLTLAIRFGANVYLEIAMLSSHATALSRSWMALFLDLNLSWCALFLAVPAALMSYRAVVRTARCGRLSYLPATGRAVFGAVVASSLQSSPVLIPAASAVVSAVLPWALGARGGDPAEMIVTLLGSLILGAACFTLALGGLWRIRPDEERIELIEKAALLVMVVANPTTDVVMNLPRAVFFGHFVVSTAQAGWLFLLPAIAAAGTLLVVRGSETIGKSGANRVRFSRSAGLALYTSRFPFALFLVTCPFEISVIVTNVPTVATVRNLILAFFGVRILWYAAYVFRCEQAFASLLHAPSTFRSRSVAYRGSLAVHLIFCLFTPLLFGIRLLLHYTRIW